MKLLYTGIESGLNNNMEYTSKDRLERALIKISRQGASQVVEIEYTTILEDLEAEYKKCKDKARRKEIREQYAVAALELNSCYKIPMYKETL